MFSLHKYTTVDWFITRVFSTQVGKNIDFKSVYRFSVVIDDDIFCVNWILSESDTKKICHPPVFNLLPEQTKKTKLRQSCWIMKGGWSFSLTWNKTPLLFSNYICRVFNCKFEMFEIFLHILLRDDINTTSKKVYQHC